MCTVYMIVLLVLCYMLPFSQLFRLLHGYNDLFQEVEIATDHRSEEAKQYFSNINPKDSRTLYSNRLKRRNLTFAVGIVTVMRAKENNSQSSFGYLLQSTSILDRMVKHYPLFNNSVIFVCNVDAFPARHLDAVNLYQFMPYTERYGQNSMGIDLINMPGLDIHFKEITNHKSKYQKETFDYSFCLLSAAALEPQYVILIEDDTIAHRDFPVVLEHLIQIRLNVTHEHLHTREFAFLKLYFPAKWQGFGFEIVSLLDLVSWSVIGGTLLGLVYLICGVRQRHVSYNTTRLLQVTFLMAMISCWLVGRQNMNELRRASRHFYRLKSSEECCTQAMLYPIHIVHSLSQFLISGPVYQHTDLLVSDFCYDSGLQAFQVEPNLFLHIGLHTSLDSEQKHPEEFINT